MRRSKLGLWAGDLDAASLFLAAVPLCLRTSGAAVAAVATRCFVMRRGGGLGEWDLVVRMRRDLVVRTMRYRVVGASQLGRVGRVRGDGLMVSLSSSVRRVRFFAEALAWAVMVAASSGVGWVDGTLRIGRLWCLCCC